MNSNIEDISDLVFYVKTLLGFPRNSIEITDGSFLPIIDDAFELYTKYVPGQEDYIVICGENYIPRCGVKMDEYYDRINPCVGVSSELSSLSLSSCGAFVVSSETTNKVFIGTEYADISLSPITKSTNLSYDANLNLNSPISTTTYHQGLQLSYNEKYPWVSEVCESTCVRIRPQFSDLTQLSANAYLSANIPLSVESLSSEPLSAFYPPNENIGFPILVDFYLKDTQGTISSSTYKCGPICNPLSAVYRIHPDFKFTLLDCFQQPYQHLNKCSIPVSGNPDLNTVPFLSSISGNYIIDNPYYNVSSDCNIDVIDDKKLQAVCYLSGMDGRVLPLSAFNYSNATHIQIPSLPKCAEDNLFPIQSIGPNGEISFSVCNSKIDSVKVLKNLKGYFVKRNVPDNSVFWKDLCDFNNGFVNIEKQTTNMSAFCGTPTVAPFGANVDFYKLSSTTLTSISALPFNPNIDPSTGSVRKIQTVIGVDHNDICCEGSTGLIWEFENPGYGFGMYRGADNGGMNNNNNGNLHLATYYAAKSFIESHRRLLRPISYSFNPKTQILKITPEPNVNCNKCFVLGIRVEPFLHELVNEEFVKNYVYGRVLQMIGKIRGKNGTVQLVGGATIDGSSASAEGEKIVTEALADLRDNHRYGSDPGIAIY